MDLPRRRDTEKKPATVAQVEIVFLDLFSQDFEPKVHHPVTFGLERAKFEITRMQKIIRFAEGSQGSVIKRRVEGWRRKLIVLEQTRDHYLKLVQEASSLKSTEPPQKVSHLSC